MPTSSYERPFLYKKQQKAIFTPKRWALCEASTKSGKTVGAIARIIEWGLIGNGTFAAAENQNYWWVAPVSDQARIAFSRVKAGLTRGSFSSKESPTPIIQLMTGPTLAFKSADNPDSLYGEDVYGVVGDEASRWKAEAWPAIRSTLTATRGPGVFIGNVKGKKNWFYEWCRRAERGLDPNAAFSRITWRDAVEAGVLDLEEIEDARRNLPSMIFQELYEAVASDDSGNPFGEDHIYACVEPGLSNLPPVAFGVDLAKSRDWLVVIGLDERGRVCVFQRWQGVPWRESIRRIHETVGEDTPTLIDSTGVGDPVLEELQVEHGNITGFHFGNLSKQRLMEGLAVSIQSHEIGYPDGPIKNELLGFEFVQIPTGIRYQAAEGYSDDCVCALALAREQLSTTAPAASLMQFYGQEAQKAREQVRKEIETEETPLTLGDHFARELTSAAKFDNELTELYRNTLAQYEPEARRCFRCKEEVIGPMRVTDGQYVWHQGCI